MEKVYSKTLALFFGLIMLPAFILAQTGNVNGVVTYQGASPLGSVTVTLSDNSGNLMGTTVSNSYGEFEFTDVPYGTYTLNFSTTNAAGGVNLTDAYAVLMHLFNMYPFTPIQELAADVNGNGSVNWADYTLILVGYLTQGNPFPIGDWVFEDATIEVSGARDGGIVIQGSSSGDINGTYVPTKSYLATNFENLSTSPVITSDRNVDLGLKVDNVLSTTGFYLVFDIPQELSVTSVTSPLGSIHYAIVGQQLRISWMNENEDLVPVELGNGIEILNIEVNTANASDGEVLSLNIDGQSHFIDTKGEIIPYTAISMPAIKFSTPQDFQFSTSVYPNPCVSRLNMEYTLPSEGNLSIVIYNSNGQMVKEIMNNLQAMGAHTAGIDVSDLSAGLYHYRLQFKGEKEIIKTGSMIKSK